MWKLISIAHCIILLSLTLSREVNSAWPTEHIKKLAREVITSEHEYLKSLEDLVMGYLNPMLEYLKRDTEKHRIISTLFSNVEDLYEFHLSFYLQLQEQEQNPVGFGQLFVAYQYKFRLYCVYCTNYKDANDLYNTLLENPEFKSFFLKCQENLGLKLPFGSDLLKPIQRITKYPLLFRKGITELRLQFVAIRPDVNTHNSYEEFIKKYPDDGVGYDSIANAAGVVETTALLVDEAQKHKNAVAKLDSLKSSVSSGSLTRSSSTKDLFDTSRNGDLVLESECKYGPKWSSGQAMLYTRVLQVYKKKGEKIQHFVSEIWVGHMHVDHKYYTEKSNKLKVESTFDSSRIIELEFSNARTQEKWYNEILGIIRGFKENRISSPAIESFKYYEPKSPFKSSSQHVGRTGLGNIKSPSLTSPGGFNLASPRHSFASDSMSFTSDSFLGSHLGSASSFGGSATPQHFAEFTRDSPLPTKKHK